MVVEEEKQKEKMLDSISPFKRKRHLLRQFNCFQFFKSRFGIGNSISYSLCHFSGLHPHLRIHLFLDNYFNSFFSHFYILKRIKYFFLTNKNNLDHFLHKEMIACINVFKTIRCLRGRRHSTFLPVRGQRNRTNARTRKIIYLGINQKSKKKKKNTLKNNIVKNTQYNHSKNK
jgi:small subunit ribosomal protein S13